MRKKRIQKEGVKDEEGDIGEKREGGKGRNRQHSQRFEKL